MWSSAFVPSSLLLGVLVAFAGKGYFFAVLVEQDRLPVLVVDLCFITLVTIGMGPLLFQVGCTQSYRLRRDII